MAITKFTVQSVELAQDGRAQHGVRVVAFGYDHNLDNRFRLGHTVHDGDEVADMKKTIADLEAKMANVGTPIDKSVAESALKVGVVRDFIEASKEFVAAGREMRAASATVFGAPFDVEAFVRNDPGIKKKVSELVRDLTNEAAAVITDTSIAESTQAAPRIVDWSTMSPREVYDALKSAPKVAGPWQRYFTRGAVRDTLKLSSANMGSEDNVVFHCGDYRLPDRASFDAALRAAGWILVDDEEKAGEKKSA